LPETVEVLADQEFTQIETFIAERGRIYDLIWVSRTHNLVRMLPFLKNVKARLVLDSEAVAANREAAKAALHGEAFDLTEAVKAEFASIPKSTRIVAVSAKEASQIKAAGYKHVSVLGTARAPALTAPGFAARADLLFVGAIHQNNSPNLDSLRWYVDEILPALTRDLGEAPVLHVAGHVAKNVVFDLAHPRVNLHGEVSDLTPLYGQCRLFIAPTRFAAGTPYKLYEAASYGVPIVATELLAKQLGWGEALLSAPVDDAQTFARQIALLYEDEALWAELRDNAARRLQAENDPGAFAAEVAAILSAP
jgi:hypothetical protein